LVASNVAGIGRNRRVRAVPVPALAGCTSQGETREEALTMIREAIELYLESLDAHGDPLRGPIEVERVTVEA
jgi:predicted RNase H-like HicB family nuclease